MLSAHDRVAVHLVCDDPLTRAGIAAALRTRPELRLVGDTDAEAAAVALVAAEDVDDDVVRVVRAAQRRDGCRVVLVLTHVDEKGLLAAVEAGVSGVLRRADAAPENLDHAVRCAANGDGTLAPDLLGRLLDAVGRLHRHVLDPRGLSLASLSEREVDVLRLVADGHSTAEIAKTLSYSERTVKGVVQDVTVRLGLRNRTQAVAYALRQGFI